MEIDQNTYSAHDVAAAANVSPATLQNWLKRRVVVGHREADIEGGGVKGKHRRFSFFALMQISIAKALIDAGVTDLKQAFDAAMIFAHSGDGAGEWVEDDGLREGVEDVRHPGYPFHFSMGDTLLATAGGKTCVVLDKPGTSLFTTVKSNLQIANGFTVIDAGVVFDRVCMALGSHPNIVLDDAYPAAVPA